MILRRSFVGLITELVDAMAVKLDQSCLWKQILQSVADEFDKMI
jgi:hypothetical protein